MCASVSVTVIYVQQRKRALQLRKISSKSKAKGTTLICITKNRKNLQNTWAPQRYVWHKYIYSKWANGNGIGKYTQNPYSSRTSERNELALPSKTHSQPDCIRKMINHFGKLRDHKHVFINQVWFVKIFDFPFAETRLNSNRIESSLFFYLMLVDCGIVSSNSMQSAALYTLCMWCELVWCCCCCSILS